jgi:hypothetical protein
MNSNPTIYEVGIYRGDAKDAELGCFPLAAETPARGKNQSASGSTVETENGMLRLKL